MKFVDTDGQEILPYNVVRVDNRGQGVARRELSSVTESAIKDLMKTTEGRAFFSQYAKKDDVLGDYTFPEDGSLSNVKFKLWDYSYEEGERPPYVEPGAGSISVSEDLETVTMQIVSAGSDKYEVGELFSHGRNEYSW